MDRREYERVNVDARGTFIVKKDNQFVTEFTAKIVDVSEKGIRVEIVNDSDKDMASLITEDSTVSFQAMENFKLYHKETSEFFTGDVQVVYKVINEDSLILGCRLPRLNDSMKNYISDRKISIFIENIGKFNND